jgi:hypothetical protein
MKEVKNAPNFYKMASTFGLIMGLAIAAIHFIFYLLNGKFNGAFAVMFLTLAAVIFIIVKGTLVYRNALGGYISYWHAFIFGVMIFVFAGIVGAVYSYVFNTLDPEYAYLQLETAKQQLMNAGLDEIKINDFISDMKTTIDYRMQHPFQSVVSSAIGNTILGSIFCLISSAFIRKNKQIIIDEP